MARGASSDELFIIEQVKRWSRAIIEAGWKLEPRETAQLVDVRILRIIDEIYQIGRAAEARPAMGDAKPRDGVE
jgi:hypothetical protein